MNFVKSYLSHLTGYVVAGATIVSGLDPKLIPPQYAFFTALAGLIVTAGHHGFTAGNANAVIAAAAQAATSTAAKILLVAIFAVATVSGLSACKSTPTVRQQAEVAIVVDIAAGYAIQRQDSDPSAWKARASEYKAIAVKLKAIDEAGIATLATLQADLQPLIAKLPPADQLAANAFVNALVPYLTSQLQSNPTAANTQAVVDLILQAVIDACGAYGA